MTDLLDITPVTEKSISFKCIDQGYLFTNDLTANTSRPSHLRLELIKIVKI